MAKSDAKQQLTPMQLKELLSKIVERNSISENKEFLDRLSELRLAINNIDDEILQIFRKRMRIAEEIGRYKKNNNVTILQTTRWEELLNNHTNNGATMGMNTDFIKKIYHVIHDESIRIQTEIMNSENENTEVELNQQ